MTQPKAEQPPADAPTGPLCRGHTNDIDRLYARHSHHDAEIISVKSRVESVEARVRVVEGNIATMAADIHRINDGMSHSQKDREEIKDMLSTLTKTLTIHMTDDITRREQIAKEQEDHARQAAEIQERNTKQIHALTRAVVIGTTVLGVLSITLMSLRAIILEEELNISILGTLFGLGG